ncbi:MAG: hypothetical protein C0167_03110 [Nitrososphaera sp.]|jgi:hypothetical protein|nr:MAG: hypothetical protein C0167_03110 [Nitrososphaera sp.]
MSEFTLMPVELHSKEDVARLACALEKIPKPVLALRKDDGYMVGSIGEELQDGSVLFFYHEESTVGDYLCYRIDGGRETAYYSQDAPPLPTICSPVIKFKSFPIRSPSRHGDGRGKSQLLPVEAEDLQSVAKMGLYRAALDEPPGVLYYIPCGSGIFGSFVRASEDNGPVLFIYNAHPEPSSGFLKTNPSRMGRVEFASSPSEPGYVYLKIVRLKNCPDFLHLPSDGPDESPAD